MRSFLLLFLSSALLLGCKDVGPSVKDDPDINLPPYAVSGPIDITLSYIGETQLITLEFSDSSGNPVPAGQFDPDGDEVFYSVSLGLLGTLDPVDIPVTSVTNGVFSVGRPSISTTKTANFVITATDMEHQATPVQPLNEISVVFFTTPPP